MKAYLNKISYSVFIFIALMNGTMASNIPLGQDKSALCVGCHGNQGISVSDEYPNLAGQKEQYLQKQLTDFKNGTRNNPTMKVMAGALSQEDIQNLAAYYASLQP
jgi:cytochrome c553